MDELISIIIVNYNGEEFLKPCLDSLNNMNKKNYSLEIIVVDNLSKDESVNFIKS